MIIIENTIGKTDSEIRGTVIVAVALATGRNPKVWVHVEKEHREVVVNTDDDPVRPGMLSYENYNEGGVSLDDLDFDAMVKELGL